MRYFLIAGEASGDLHASNLMYAIQHVDTDAEFCFCGGDRMSAVGGTRLRHYRTMAYMGFVPVLLHLDSIMHAMKICKRFVMRWKPDVVILIDYPGFNLKIADFVRHQTDIPVFYYISPKIWAWKEYRIEQLRENVTELYSILPFEVPFFEQKHHFPIHYVGNPSVDEITVFKQGFKESVSSFTQKHGLSNRPIIALLPGSRQQEIKDNLRRMCKSAKPFLSKGYQIVVAGVSDIPLSFYNNHLRGLGLDKECLNFHILNDATLSILSFAEAALVTSGTATLETALMKVPQVVCYYAPLGAVIRFLKRKFLKVAYISLVNLIVGREVVPELIADQMNERNMSGHLKRILKGGEGRQTMLDGYEEMIAQLGPAGAPQRAASLMVSALKAQTDASE